MNVSKAWLHSIAANSLSLPQRIEAGCRPSVDTRSEVVGRLRDRWIQTAGDGDEAAWLLRLERSGWSEQVCALLDRVEFSPDSALPHWMVHLEDLVESIAAPAREKAGFVDDRRPVAFEAVLAPVVLRASARLRQRLGGLVTLLAPGAFRDLERMLLEDLSRRAAASLSLRLEAHRAAVACDPMGEGGGFLDWMRAGGVLRIFEDAPVLARGLSTTVGFWIESNAEWIGRFAADRDALAQWAGRACGVVGGVCAPVSDAHSGGRRVLVLSLEEGFQCVYKPRPVDLEWAVGRFSQREPGVVQPSMVRRSGYGWVEHVGVRDCADFGEVHGYYLRMGEALAVFHLLGSTDLHSHNFFARGPEPVLVDGEFLVGQAEHSGRGAGGAVDEASAELCRSVFFTKVLPRWREALEGGWCDHSAVGISGGGGEWRCVPGSSRPHVGGRAVDPASFGGALLDGFTRRYRRMLADPARVACALREAFCEPVRVRVSVRGDEDYKLLAAHGGRLEMLRNGAERFVEWDVLARLHQTTGKLMPLWAFLAEEHAALERHDFPWLWTFSDTRDVCFPGGRVDGVFEQTPCEVLDARLAQLSWGDLERQALYIRSAGAAAPISTMGGGRKADAPAGNGGGADLLAAAERIALGLAERSRRAGPHLTQCYLGHGGRFRLEGMPMCVRNGRLGMAVFFQALHRVRPAEGWRVQVDALWGTVREWILGGRGDGRVWEDPLICGALEWMAREWADAEVLELVAGAGGPTIPRARSVVECSWEEALLLRLGSGASPGEAGLRALSAELPTDSYFSGRAGVLELALASGANGFAREQAGALALRAAEGALVFHPAVDGSEFFEGLGHGVAGVGFALLRVAAPELVPSVLSWGARGSDPSMGSR